MAVQSYVESMLKPILVAKASAASAKTSATAMDGIDDLAEAIAYGVTLALTDPGLHASISSVVVTPLGGPVGTLLSAAIMGQSTAVPPTP